MYMYVCIGVCVGEWPVAGAEGWGRRGGEQGTGMGTAPYPPVLETFGLYRFQSGLGSGSKTGFLSSLAVAYNNN
ncbi:hypothetical protein HanRHA438_Chr16g0766591 [Helianthus annuus]|nr:hypothetical protein HanRHA438_Chr16g0766591 [Helianthus annuus]